MASRSSPSCGTGDAVPGASEVTGSGGLDGTWRVKRLGGLLPPLGLVRKEIAGGHGRTVLAGLALGFDVTGCELRYRRPLKGFVDVLEEGDGPARRGTATLFGRTFGSFLMTRE
jgi:hypothetical protein